MNRIALAILLLVGCADSGRDPATVELVARGAPSAVFTDGGFTITLTRADIAFGPAYFCATAATSTDLCDTAVLETLDAHPIDGIDATDQPLGELRGLTGTVRSVQYDLGIAFLLAGASPEALPGSIDGHSVVLEGHATDGMTSFDFVATVDVTAELSGTTAVVGARTEATIPSSGARLTLAVDPSRWLAGLDWTALSNLPHGVGEPVVVAEGTLAHDAILRGITTNAPVAFEWIGVDE